MQAALGFRAHSGWAAMVAAAGTLDAPVVLERRRIVLAAPTERFPYHTAAELPLGEAEALIGRAVETSRALACEAISAAVKALGRLGHQVTDCRVLLGSGKVLPGIASILTSHALIHAAEGAMFRDVLMWAARECDLPVLGVREKELPATALARLASLGKSIGPPWTQDQKLATLAALTPRTPEYSTCAHPPS